MLSYESIKNLLLQEHFHITNETSKKIAMNSSSYANPIYINKTAGNSPSGLIIHPDHVNLRQDLSLIRDVIHQDNWYHSSNMRLFPQRINKGKNPIGYGIPFGFESETGLKNFLQLLQSEVANSDDPFADIEVAKSELSSVSETTRDALIKSRIGQGPYREKLIKYWSGCAVTGCKNVELLIASHAKPWIKSNNDERLDPFNGLLLTPNLDKAFDKGFITFMDNGDIKLSLHLPISTYKALGINESMRLTKTETKHLPFLQWHRNYIFKK
jgi:hypothetical protein